MKLVLALLLAVLGCAVLRAQTGTIVPASTTYAPEGGTQTFAVTLTYSEPASSVGSMGVSLTVPAGWTFAGVEGPNRPQINPDEGITGNIGFAYSSAPSSPARFSFTLNYPAGLTGDQVFINVQALVRISGAASAVQIAMPDIRLTLAGSGGGGPITVAPAIITQPQGQNVNEGQGATFSVTASGTAPLTYQWRKDSVAIAGATASSLIFSSVTAASAGTYTVVVANAAGSVISNGAVLTVKAAAQAPQIVAQPQSVTVAPGTGLTLSVVATGAAPLTYQWRKSGTVIAAATGATLSLSGQAADAGSYLVVISNSAGTVTSGAAIVAFSATTPTTPVSVTIVTPPLAQTALAGGAVSFSVVATGSAPLAYQWQKDGVVLPGATAATLALTNIAASALGSYRVVVSNATSSVTSPAAALTLAPRILSGTYLGSLTNDAGGIALLVRSDRTGVLLGFARGARVGLLGLDMVIDAAGHFSVTQPDVRPATGATVPVTPPTAAHEGEFHIEGTIAADGSVAGTISGLNLTFAASATAANGPTADMAGFYQAGAIGGSARSYALVTPVGQALVVNVTGATADGGVGTVTAAGALAVTTAGSATITGTIIAAAGTLATAVTSSAGTVNFAGANNDARVDFEKLINISTRSETGTTANTLIAGFVITGEAAKPVLVRAVGPTLGSAFNVAGAVSAARLEIYRGQTLIAAGGDWGTPPPGGASVAAIVATTARVGAFGLPATSRDAALLLTLEPGAYTAVVTGQNGASGVCLVEIYDATDGAIPRGQRIINIATRATAGTGDRALIAGFYVNGTVPKRLLIRGVGPTLAQFGIGGVLARPELTVSAGTTVLARNAGWSSSADAASIATSSAQVGAFAFAAGSADSALILHLAPGAYTAQVAGAGNTTGVALVEVYELP